MYDVQITTEKLNELRMLADWQLRTAGFDPASITAACLLMDYERSHREGAAMAERLSREE